MLDLFAPIIPGESAAGIRVGAEIADSGVLAGVAYTVENVYGGFYRNLVYIRYVIDNVYIETRPDNIIDQIIVHGQYGGKLNGCIGIGSTINELEDKIGPCVEDDVDNLVIESVPGLCLAIEEIVDPKEWKKLKITHFCVYPID